MGQWHAPQFGLRAGSGAVKVMIMGGRLRLFAAEHKRNRAGGVRAQFHDCCIYLPRKRAWWFMTSAMTYSFWGLGILAMGGIVLATLVW